MTPPRIWEVVAHNTATLSDNKIHDDEVARRFGFGGGLVPGVDVYAYLTHLPAQAWGVPWLERGTMRARFLRPVYDGRQVTIQAEEPAGDGAATMELELRDEGGELCAAATATLPAEPSIPPPADHWADVPQAEDPPAASPEALAPGTVLGLQPHRFVADRAGEYLTEIREDLELYRTARVAHPGWLLRDANYVLAANVVLGPWIHVESDARHFRTVGDGEVVGGRAIVTREWEHKGHRFVELDVALTAGGAVAVRVTHTAIHRPRQAGAVRG
jgi:hypothetical protein